MGSVTAAFWTMIGLQTLGSVDVPGKGERKLPAPRSYVAIIILFSILHLVSEAGQERAASVASWVTVLFGMVKGPFGGQVASLFDNVSRNFGVTQQQQPADTTGTVQAAASPLPASPFS